MTDFNKPPRYLYESDGRYNPELERRGLIPLTLPPLHKERIRVPAHQITLPPMNQFLQMTFANRHVDLGQNQCSTEEINNVYRQSRPLPPRFRSDHKIWNLLRMTNYYLPDDLHYAIVTGQHPQAISELIVRLEADYCQRATRFATCYDLPILCSDPSHPIWDLLLLTDYDLPDEVRDAINECRPLLQLREICERLLRVWCHKPRM